VKFQKFRIVGDKPDGSSSLPHDPGPTLLFVINFYNSKVLIDNFSFMIQSAYLPNEYAVQDDPVNITHLIISDFKWYYVNVDRSVLPATESPPQTFTIMIDPPEPRISKQIILPTSLTAPDFIVPLAVGATPSTIIPVDSFLGGMIIKLLEGVGSDS